MRKIINECYFGEDLKEKERELFNLKNQHVYIEPPFQFDYGTNIHFSGRFYANRDCLFLDTTDIYFGSNVTLGPRVQIYTTDHSHPSDIKRSKNSAIYLRQVVIEDNVFIGGGSIINAGVTIGKNSVVASGSVVTKSVLPNTLVGGVPAKVIRTFDED
nr:sugar O-acetyltransferase [Lactococcus sp. S64]